jgi:hypothetical protein
MGGNLGIPDVSQLPIQSDVSQYNLRNASAAFTPQPTPPPTLTPDQSIADLEQRSLQTFQNPPQYQPDFQQPQFQQPGSHDLQPLIDQVVADSRQANVQRGTRIRVC